MKRGTTGKFVKSSVSGEEINAFVPEPLPPKTPIVFDAARQKLLEEATLALGRLDSITLLLPDADIFLYSYVRKEAVLSSQIEGTQSSLSDLMLFELEGVEGVPFDDVVEVSRYVAALNHGIKRLNEGFPLCNRLIKEMHQVLLEGARGATKQPGEFRKSQNWIGGIRPSLATFVPPPPNLVPELMEALEQFFHDEEQPYPTLIKAALSHVQFETIHPFLDGNGRMGRLLISFILYHERLLERPLLYLSLFFKEHREQYYQFLNGVRFGGEWEAWIDFFLEGVRDTAKDAVTTAQKLVACIKEDEERIRVHKKRSASALQCLHAFSERPLAKIATLQQMTGLSFQAIDNAIKEMQKLGIVEEVTKKSRNRVFKYTRFIEILNK